MTHDPKASAILSDLDAGTRSGMYGTSIGESASRKLLASALLETAALLQYAAHLESQVLTLPGSGVETDAASLPGAITPERRLRTALTAAVPATMALLAVVTYLEAMATSLLAAEGVLPTEALARAVIEACAICHWLLDDRINGEQRLARYILLRHSSATEDEKAHREIELTIPEKQSVAYVIAIASDYGIPVQLVGKKQNIVEVAGERLPGPTLRAKSLLAAIEAKGAYNIYSGTAHREIYCLFRMFTSPTSVGGESFQAVQFDTRAAANAVFVSVRAAVHAGALVRAHRGEDLANWEADALNILGPLFAVLTASEHSR